MHSRCSGIFRISTGVHHSARSSMDATYRVPVPVGYPSRAGGRRLCYAVIPPFWPRPPNKSPAAAAELPSHEGPFTSLAKTHQFTGRSRFVTAR